MLDSPVPMCKKCVSIVQRAGRPPPPFGRSEGRGAPNRAVAAGRDPRDAAIRSSLAGGALSPLRLGTRSVWRGQDFDALRIAPCGNRPNAAGNELIASRLHELIKARARELGLPAPRG